MLHTIAIHSSGFSDQHALAEAVKKHNRVLGAVAYLNEKHVVSATVVVFPTNSAGVHSTALVTILNAPQAVCAELDRQLAMLEQHGPEGNRKGCRRPGCSLTVASRLSPIPVPTHETGRWTSTARHSSSRAIVMRETFSA